MSDPIVAGDFGFSAAQLDALLAEAGIDLLLASSKHNIRYLLDGHHHHFFAHMDAIGISRYLPILVYPSRRPGDAAYVANRNEKDAIAVRAAEGRPLWAGTVLPAASGSAEAMGVAIGHLRRVGVSPRTIGVEMGFLPADAYLALRDAFPDAKIVDAHRPLERLRSVKTPAELARLRDASDRVVDAMLAVIGSHGPGTTKRELEAALRREESQRGLVFEYALITVGSSHGRAPSNEVWQAGDISRSIPVATSTVISVTFAAWRSSASRMPSSKTCLDWWSASRWRPARRCALVCPASRSTRPCGKR